MSMKGGKPENLIRYKPGQSGNLKGRPKKLPNLNELLAHVLGNEDAQNITEAEKIIKTLVISAKQGSTKAAEILLDRGWGKVTQTIEANIQQLTTIIDVTGEGHSVQQEAGGSPQDS